MDTYKQQRIGVRPVDSAMGEDIRGVAVGLGEDGRVVAATSGLAGMSRHERALVAAALADLLAEVMGHPGEDGAVRVH